MLTLEAILNRLSREVGRNNQMSRAQQKLFVSDSLYVFIISATKDILNSLEFPCCNISFYLMLTL